MATASRTYGNTLSDLQAGTNADKAITFSRQNAEDTTSQQRLEAFLRLRGQELQVKAQQNKDAADRAQRMAELIQQDKQFSTSEGNRMQLGQLDSDTRKEVARTTAERVDPRFYQNFAQIQALNQEKQQRFDYLNRLSETRKQLARKQKAMMDNRGFMDYGAPNAGFFNRSVSPEWTDIQSKIKALDAQAAAQVDPDTGIGVVVDPETGGYIFPPFNPIPIPEFGRPVIPSPAGEAPAQVIPQTQVPAMLQRGDVTIGGVPLSGFIGSEAVIPVQPVPAPAPRRTLRFDPATMDFVP